MNSVINQIVDSMPLQRKKLEKQLSELSENEINELNLLCDTLSSLSKEMDLDDNFIAKSYKQMNTMMLKEQIFFQKNGKYKSDSQSFVYDSMYNVEEKMIGHMISLALTQFLWKNHYKMMKYFKKQIINYIQDNVCILEIGAGHGLFTKELLNLKYNLNIDILDISETSIKLSKKIIENSNNSILSSINFIHSDVMNFSTNKKYEFISLSEVLEHVDNPLALLKSIKNISTGGEVLYI